MNEKEYILIWVIYNRPSGEKTRHYAISNSIEELETQVNNLYDINAYIEFCGEIKDQLEFYPTKIPNQWKIRKS